MAYTVIWNKSGKRVFAGADDGKVQLSGRTIAKACDIGETSVREVSKGETRKGWKKTEYQRMRDNMVISYRLTYEGRTYKDKASGLYGAFLRVCEMGEASDIAEKLLSLGWDKIDRRRVLQLAARAKDMGLLEVFKRSGRIFGRG